MKTIKTIKMTAGQTAKTFAAIVIACGLIFSSCKKGDTGPAGATGAAGNANVQTYTIAVNSSNWAADSQDGWYTSFTATGFDPTKGATSMFLSNNNTYWQALPFVASTTSQVNINYSFTSSLIQVNYDPPIGVLSVAQPTSTIYFKIVVIPPAMVKPHVNPHNYAELAAAYNL